MELMDLPCYEFNSVFLLLAPVVRKLTPDYRVTLTQHFVDIDDHITPWSNLNLHLPF